ncbi:unnamed protein product [Vitrella brassicaformis CCMP3155]|uniref:Aminopeptidase N n=2 Tax=Vitrella brassicaformis TaxID=1169539 RepID=A0A0G4EQU1_VITBC|nr:unnamed protein product [Vitrella brassicaformis CCMP3155]|eukprot:CEM00603.1 unnamed protein product [Vitrella brassicaformis CCMP3155]
MHTKGAGGAILSCILQSGSILRSIAVSTAAFQTPLTFLTRDGLNSSSFWRKARSNHHLVRPSRAPAPLQTTHAHSMASQTQTVTQTATAAAEQVKEVDLRKPPKEKKRLDYRPPEYWIKKVDLDFDVHKDTTTVRSVLTCYRNRGSPSGADLVLHGEDLTLKEVKLNGKVLSEGAEGYGHDEDKQLVIRGKLLPADPDELFKVETTVAICPEKNFQLSGLYKSGGMYCTQCEAEGFRRITYFLDRPDVMSLYTVRVEASKSEYPVLLSNGNQISSGDAADGRHYASFEDPHPKPCYLFALVVGNLKSIHSDFTTTSGRKVRLEIFSEPHNVAKLDWAMESLKKAMKWDEEKFGREYDLDVFNIVAVDDFNMGAMENKGLNVFNTALILASPDTSTDADYERIMGVIAHEYFHNWTGNRVTCRDWFQLTLKEGLTVFRDQEFSRDMASAAVKRIEDIIMLRSRQFPEDAGPMAHPIRPESYIAMDNFYTATVYEKGAEVIRMYQTLLSKHGFRKGMDLYFTRHDGQAVTCDDFRAAMADANTSDLKQFERWYLQAGTPVVTVESASYDPSLKQFTIVVSQSTPATPGQAEKHPLHIPIKTGLLSKATGKELQPSMVLELKGEKETFVFDNVPEEPIASILRDFSAPCRLKFERSPDDLAFLMAHDTDDFNRWEAGQTLATIVIKDTYNKLSAGESPPALPGVFVEAWRKVLTATDIDRSLQTYSLRLPDEKTLIGEIAAPIAPDHLHNARQHVRKGLVEACKKELREVYDKLTQEVAAEGGVFKVDEPSIARRRLRNALLISMAVLQDPETVKLAVEHFETGLCMSDRISALYALADIPVAEREAVIQKFYGDSKDDKLKMCKWFAVQAQSDLPDTVERVKELMKHPDFELKNPNKLRAVVGAFANNNFHFHRKDGAGYSLVCDVIKEVDKLNPQMASRFAVFLAGWKNVEPVRSAMMKAQLERLRDTENLSNDTMEIVIKGLSG